MSGFSAECAGRCPGPGEAVSVMSDRHRRASVNDDLRDAGVSSSSTPNSRSFVGCVHASGAGYLLKQLNYRDEVSERKVKDN